MSDENKKLTPVYIIYVNKTRMNTDYEGALQSIQINETLTAISKAYI